LRIASTGARSSSGTASTNADLTVLLKTTPLRDIEEEADDDEEEDEEVMMKKKKRVELLLLFAVKVEKSL
jgi:hypothetical protein